MMSLLEKSNIFIPLRGDGTFTIYYRLLRSGPNSVSYCWVYKNEPKYPDKSLF